MADVLFISKPVAPPWNDSGKNLVRDLASHMRRHTPVLMTTPSSQLGIPRSRLEMLYKEGKGRFSPAIGEHAKVFARLVLGKRYDLWHFFFAPNPKTSLSGRAVTSLRRVPTVQTLCSAPRDDLSRLDRLLFTDRIVVLSRHTERRVLNAGIASDRVVRIPPAVPECSPPTSTERSRARAELGLPQTAPVIVYPGDLEFGSGAQQMLDATRRLRGDVRVVMACREKTSRAKERRRELESFTVSHGITDRVVWIGETLRILDLLGAADVVALPSDTLYAKMDYPLVVLEAMSLGRPVIVGKHTPAEELAEHGAVVVGSQTDELVSVIDSLLNDSQRASDLGSRGRASVTERFHPTALADAYESLYDDLI